MLSQKLDKIIKKEDLPSLSVVVYKLNELLSDEYVSINKVSAAIENDPSLTSRILRLANSSYYGLSSKVGTISRAVTVLGFNTVRNIVLTVLAHEIFAKADHSTLDVKSLWYHSLGCAVVSRRLVVKKDCALCEKAFICGLIHDIGKVIIAQNMPVEMENVLKRLKEDRTLVQSRVEKDIIGFSHADVGGYMLKTWHFPIEYVNAVKFHHNFELCKESVLRCSVYVGNQISKALLFGRSSDEKMQNINIVLWKLLGVSESNLSSLLLDIKADFKKILDSFENIREI